jgi:hypothetical protein
MIVLYLRRGWCGVGPAGVDRVGVMAFGGRDRGFRTESGVLGAGWIAAVGQRGGGSGIGKRLRVNRNGFVRWCARR